MPRLGNLTALLHGNLPACHARSKQDIAFFSLNVAHKPYVCLSGATTQPGAGRGVSPWRSPEANPLRWSSGWSPAHSPLAHALDAGKLQV